MARCAGSKPSGEPCERIVGASQTYCFSHDPGRRDERRRNASRAGRSKANREIVAIRGRLSALAEDVLAGRVDRADAAVAGQLLGTVIRAIGVEVKVKEVEEVAREVEELRELLDARKGGRPWGYGSS